MIKDTVRIFWRIIKAGVIMILGISVCLIATVYYIGTPILGILQFIKYELSMPIWVRIVYLIVFGFAYIFGAILVFNLFKKFANWWENINTDIALPMETERNLRLYTTSSTYIPPNDEPVEIESSPNGVITVSEKENGINILSDVPQKRRLII